MKIWTNAYFPFAPHGKEERPIIAEVDTSGPIVDLGNGNTLYEAVFDLGEGFIVRPGVTRLGHPFILEMSTGAVAFETVESMREKIAEHGPLLKESLDSVQEHLETAITVSPEKLWLAVEYVGAFSDENP